MSVLSLSELHKGLTEWQFFRECIAEYDGVGVNGSFWKTAENMYIDIFFCRFREKQRIFSAVHTCTIVAETTATLFLRVTATS